MSPGASSGRALIVADGRIDDAQLRREAAVPDTFIIGADGGAGRAHDAAVRVDLVVGDLDSIAPGTLTSLAAAGTRVERADRDKDESDTELALLAALEHGHRPIVILGALGGARLDHELANLLLLAHPRLDGRDVSIVDGPTTVRRMGTVDGPGLIDLEGAAGDLVDHRAFSRHHACRAAAHAEPLPGIDGKGEPGQGGGKTGHESTKA